MKNISQIVNSGLCLGCGTCAGMCPGEAIEMKIIKGSFYPSVKDELCNSCKTCLKTCPGYSVDFEELSQFVFGKKYEEGLLGNLLNCYIGHSNNNGIRYNSASGGLASQILIYALEEAMVDGALVVRMKEKAPLETESFIARSKEDILEASGSKYCPVTLAKALRQILREDGRFAFVGLPCHIHGIRKAEKLSVKLREKIELHIGLLCSHTVDFTGTELLIKKLKIKKADVTSLRYRGKGWPGSMRVKTNNGQCFEIPLIGSWRSYWPLFSSFFFTPLRCIMCPDQSAEFSDISLGDPWLPQMRSEKLGKSIVITRTKKGENIINALKSAGLISIAPISFDAVVASQFLNLRFKKRDLSPRLKVLEALGREVPKIVPCASQSFWLGYLKAFIPYFNVLISSNKLWEKVIKYSPFELLRLYSGLCRAVLSL